MGCTSSSLRHVQPESLPAPTTTNKWGITPLAFAAWRGDAARLAEVLAADGAQAQLAATDCDGWDALAFAVRGGCPTCVRLLCEAGAAVNAASARDGRTALHSAALAAGASCVAALLEAGADTAARDGLGRTALQYAQQRLAGELEAEARAPFQRPAEALLEAQKVAGLLRAAAEGLPFSRAPPREEQAAPAPAGALAESSQRQAPAPSAAQSEGAAEPSTPQLQADSWAGAQSVSSASDSDASAAGRSRDSAADSSPSRECRVCLQGGGELIALIPCGHRATCGTCTARLMLPALAARWAGAGGAAAEPPCRCPVCRSEVTGSLRVFDV